MARNILTVSVAEFRLIVSRVPVDQLKSLTRALGEIKWTRRGKLPDEAVQELELKTTIIEKELRRRGIVNQQNHEEFKRWRNKEEYRKKNY